MAGDTAEQGYDALLAELARQEDELQFERFGHHDAWALGSWIVENATARSLSVAVSIVFGPQRVFHAALPGTRRENDLWLERKIRTVTSYAQSSYRVGVSFRSRGADFASTSWHDPHEYAAFGGGFPLRINGTLFGAVAVSGLAEADDHALVVSALAAIRASAAPPIG